MMRGCAVVQFEADGVVKIAPFELVRNLNKTPFCPKSALDVPKDDVWVKWQKSIMDQEEYNDGYFKATVLLLAKTPETAKAKAQELGIKLPLSPMICLPPSKSTKKRDKSATRLRARGSVSPSANSKQQKTRSEKTQLDGNQKKSSNKKRSAVVLSDEQKHDKAKRRKPNKAASNPVSAMRLDKVLHQGKQLTPMLDTFMKSPKIKEGVFKSPETAASPAAETDASPAATTKPVSSSTPIMKVKRDLTTVLDNIKDHKVKEVIRESSKSQVSEVNLESEIFSPTNNGSHEVSTKLDDKISEFQTSVETSEGKVNASKNEITEKTDKSSKVKAIENEITKNKETDQSSPVKAIETEITENKETDQSSTANDNDLVFSPLKTDNTSGNESSEDEDDLEATLPVDYAEISDEESSDSDSDDSSDSSEDSLDPTCQLLDDKEEITRKLKSMKTKLAESKRTFTICNNLRLKYKRQRDELEEKVRAQDEKIKGLQEYICDMVTGTVPKKTKDSVVSRSKHEKGESSSNQERRSSKIAAKKIKKEDLSFDNATMKKTCDIMLEHIKGSKPLEEDSNGDVTIGSYPEGSEIKEIKVKRKSLEKNFEENKLDLKKLTKNLTAMVWTQSERINRSLTGSTNNKHKDVPKSVATPVKIHTVLGVVQAHMKHLGDKEGPAMLNSLKGCEKAIGEKFATDAQSDKRKKPQ